MKNVNRVLAAIAIALACFTPAYADDHFGDRAAERRLTQIIKTEEEIKEKIRAEELAGAVHNAGSLERCLSEARLHELAERFVKNWAEGVTIMSRLDYDDADIAESHEQLMDYRRRLDQNIYAHNKRCEYVLFCHTDLGRMLC